MKAYYCISKRDREFLYIPFVLFSYCSADSIYVTHRWDKEILSKLTLMIREGKLTKNKLEDSQWSVEEIDIPDRIIEKFTDSCFRRKKEQRLITKADRIFNWVQDHMEYEENNHSNLKETKTYRDSYDGMYDEEDYRNDWWKRGEDYPSNLD